MNKARVTDRNIEITIEGIDRLLSFKSKLTIPRKCVSGAYLRPGGLHPPWLRAPGTHLPRVIAAGTFHGRGRKEFWNTRFGDRCVVIDLKDFDYTRVAVDVRDAEKLIGDLS